LAVTYTGKVEVGGAADVHTLSQLTITKVAVGAMNNNAYLLRCNATGDQVLIDAAAEPERLVELIGPDGLDAVVTTHRHGDHWGALEAVVAATGATTMAGEYDFGSIPVPTDVELAEGDAVVVGDCSLRVIHLVGHTPGSIVLVYDDPDGHPHAFTGDCLFPGGVGKTATPEDFTSLFNGVSNKLFGTLPDETWIYPGHGHDTSLGSERPALAEWKARGW